jgi:hypothetical protein
LETLFQWWSARLGGLDSSPRWTGSRSLLPTCQKIFSLQKGSCWCWLFFFH